MRIGRAARRSCSLIIAVMSLRGVFRSRDEAVVVGSYILGQASGFVSPNDSSNGVSVLVFSAVFPPCQWREPL